MADDHRLLPQRRRKRGALMRGMAREDEVGQRRQHLEASTLQSAGQPLPALDHAHAALLEIGFVLQGGDRAGLSGPAERI